MGSWIVREIIMKFDMTSCGGCRTCELACSFHHTGEFVPAVSSLKIVEKEKGPGYIVVLKEEGDEEGFACDGCDGLDIPLCVEYCREVDDLYKILREFDKEKSKEKEAQRAQKQGVHHGRK
jgi:Fe-S-cluster-containing hydrogenase component 2